MIGYGNNKGIIPISFKELFKRVESTQTTSLSYEVLVSMLEIYNEKIQDLLIPVNQRVAGGLKIRESKVAGVFVENLSKRPVCNYEEIEELMEVGNTHRSIGATQMNATSSRAHTIFTIEFKQIETDGVRKSEKLSVINLVDLAGSEKAGQTGATGDRLKEGCAINKSLVVLGSVIEALADKSQGKKGNIVIPYRDSALTRILSSALGGNSKTVMICALSPATVNYEETLSTLRYADRAKKIKNHAVVNETVQDKMIRELKEENNELKKVIDEVGGVEKILELREQIAAIERLSKEKEMSFSQKREAHFESDFKVNINGPHITNINEDNQLSGRVFYNFLKLPLTVGRKNASPPNDIVLASSSVSLKHCIFDKDADGNITLTALDERSSNFLFVNGKKVLETVVLGHLDRIIIGTSTIFLFKIPGEASIIKESDIDFEFANDEKTKNNEEEIENSLPKSVRASMRYSIIENPLPGSHQEPIITNLSESKSNAIEASETSLSSTPAPNLVNTLPASSIQVPDHIEEPISKKKQLHNKLAKLFPLINEANMLASDLGRHVKCAAKIINILPDDVKEEEDLEPERWEKELKVEVINQDYGLIWYWDCDKFEDRLCMLRELIDEENIPSPDEDPLWDPPEENLLGKGYYSLKPLGLLFDNPFDILIISAWGGDAGYLRMNIIPTDEGGQPLEEGPDSPEELVGQIINFRVEINEARNLPQSHSNNVYCEFHFPGLGIRRTSIVPGYSEQPVFNWKEQFNSVLVDEQLAKYMQTNKLAVCLYGTGMAMKVETPKRTVNRPKNETTAAVIPCAEAQMEVNAKKQQERKAQPKAQTALNPNEAGKRKKGTDHEKKENGDKKEKCIVF
jgi:kinesin family member 13